MKLFLSLVFFSSIVIPSWAGAHNKVVVVPLGNGSCCPAGKVICNEACTDLQTDPANCGGCNITCAPGSCFEGACVDCPLGDPDYQICNGSCVYTYLDNENCGDCGVVCSPGVQCFQGVCGGAR